MSKCRFSEYKNNNRANSCCFLCGTSDYDLIHKNIDTWEKHQWWIDEDNGGEIMCDSCKNKIEGEKND